MHHSLRHAWLTITAVLLSFFPASALVLLSWLERFSVINALDPHGWALWILIVIVAPIVSIILAGISLHRERYYVVASMAIIISLLSLLFTLIMFTIAAAVTPNFI